MKKEFISQIKNADILQDDWHRNILETLPNNFAKGYISAKLDWITSQIDDNEEIQEYLLEWADLDIWKQ